MIELSLILPAHNEAENLPLLIPELYSVLNTQLELSNEQFQIIVVNDGSTDSTAEVLDGLGRKFPLTVIDHQGNRGYGAALRSGFARAEGRFVAFMDSDLQLSPQDLPKLYNVRRNDSVVVGTRTPRVDPLGRVLLGAFFSRIVVPILFGVRVRDVDCALKVIPRQIVANNRLMSEGALINAELLFVSKREGFAVIECPVGHYPRRAGEQSGGSLRVVSRALWAMVSLRLALHNSAILSRQVAR
jgi:glycosyltransferase involved in cell wall biosynthesis